MRGNLRDGTKLVCTHAFAHGGPCSWSRAKPFEIFGGITIESAIAAARRGNAFALDMVEDWIATRFDDLDVGLDPNIHWPRS